MSSIHWFMNPKFFRGCHKYLWCPWAFDFTPFCRLAERCVKIYTVRQLPPGYTHQVAQQHQLFLLRSIIIYAILLLHLLFWGRTIYRTFAFEEKIPSSHQTSFTLGNLLLKMVILRASAELSSSQRKRTSDCVFKSWKNDQSLHNWTSEICRDVVNGFCAFRCVELWSENTW